MLYYLRNILVCPVQTQVYHDPIWICTGYPWVILDYPWCILDFSKLLKGHPWFYLDIYRISPNYVIPDLVKSGISLIKSGISHAIPGLVRDILDLFRDIPYSTSISMEHPWNIPVSYADILFMLWLRCGRVQEHTAWNVSSSHGASRRLWCATGTRAWRVE